KSILLSLPASSSMDNDANVMTSPAGRNWIVGMHAGNKRARRHLAMRKANAPANEIETMHSTVRNSR
ncbi:hypothetical protein AVEN_126616-1, partial [Araneus ventricosus]